MSNEPVLTEKEKEQIHLEEKLRHDVRMRQRSRIWWINTPIVIWLLSAVVAGLIPFSYLEYQKRVEIEREERQIRREAAASVLSEIEFRIAQFNEVLDRTKKTRQEAALIAEANLMDVISNNRLSETGTKLQALFSSAPLLRVTSELGGIYAISRTDEHANVWIRGSGWNNSHLPDGRGYRDEKYINDSLFSLWKKYTSLTKGESLLRSEVSDVKAVFDGLDDATTPNEAIKSLPHISSNGHTMRQWSEKVDLPAVVELRAKTISWIEGVETAWQKIRALFPDVV